MVLTNAQIASFFMQPAQMAILEVTVAHLATEGITLPDDLLDFNKDMVNAVAANCRRPPGGVVCAGIGHVRQYLSHQLARPKHHPGHPKTSL